jgi:hypothetical protein
MFNPLPTAFTKGKENTFKETFLKALVDLDPHGGNHWSNLTSSAIIAHAQRFMSKGKGYP